MYGFTGKLVSVNLSSTVRSSRDLDEDSARKFLGGSGLGAQLLSSMNWKLDPLDAECRLVFAAGPLTGTPVPLCSRFSVCAKSPLTGVWGE
ncbi:MAG: aldehyde ferredoxin oxidoreductase N-terminal domain-containing protein, partial [Thermodesulfobacteriota bacterium]|nr:aldehyde ferredoxin oxidoreductase N-terminal domain-containing protein [Thermodesulfobacteriota bacterium]